jgi:hypothetical protein
MILALATHCPDLQRLDVNAMYGDGLDSQLTDSWLEQVVRGCPQLILLDLGKTTEWWRPDISEAAILEATSLRQELRILLNKY